MKIVLNKCFGGFSISKEAAKFMAARGNKQAAKELEENKNPRKKKNGEPYETYWHGFGYVEGFPDGYDRKDPDLVAAVETLGSKVASGNLAQLEVINIPDDIVYEMQDYDGIETIHEEHDSW